MGREALSLQSGKDSCTHKQVRVSGCRRASECPVSVTAPCVAAVPRVSRVLLTEDYSRMLVSILPKGKEDTTARHDSSSICVLEKQRPPSHVVSFTLSSTAPRHLSVL